MHEAVISFISPKGYGMARLSSSGSNVFIPKKILNNNFNLKDKIEIEFEPGEFIYSYRAVTIIFQPS